MLDDINPWGLEGSDGLNAVAATLIGTAVLLLAIAIAAGALLMTVGRNGGLSRSQDRGLRMIAVGGVGLMVLTSVGGAVAWGTGLGTDNLMPEEAQQQDIVIEREEATTTCTEPQEIDFRTFRDDGVDRSDEEEREILESIVGYPWIDEEFSDRDRSDITVDYVRWYPEGPDCSAENHVGAAGTEVETQIQTSWFTGGSTRIIEAEGGE